MIAPLKGFIRAGETVPPPQLAHQPVDPIEPERVPIAPSKRVRRPPPRTIQLLQAWQSIQPLDNASNVVHNLSTQPRSTSSSK